MTDRGDRPGESAGGDVPERVLSHFASFRLGDAFWSLGSEARRGALDGLLKDARAVAARVELYQLYPTRADADLLVWSALPAGDPAAPGRFFEGFGRAVAARRPALIPSHALWGLTRPSPYTGRGGSSREIDAVGGERGPYLIVYPFAKTSRWYLRPEGERREMMREHIRIGRQFEGVRQLLLYSFGLQDQEFVVVYETRDLAAFSELVYALRATEAREFTALDSPVLTALYRDRRDSQGAGAAEPWS